ncbi:MAG: hypothetical protein B7Z54_04545 [Sphingobacteriales bacterium 12-47-4]|nr:MAG: hypothetical protein B7Z54_04545 [Sphingobacteriales bacterium 12-47-4]
MIDYDPTIKRFYSPVDLDDKYLLAESGLAPSEGNPQFHQQMVYAVSMTTIKNFEKALGRQVIWGRRRVKEAGAYEIYVPKLRIYPHALREANAYYSPLKKALLFGYFSSSPAQGVNEMPDSLVFTCLSHDIIAHEVTHAILDGMFPFYNEPTNPDVLAFHEAFSDIVALFQHFTFPDVLKHQIGQTKGDLSSQNLLGQLAQQFGSAIGGYGSLRDAIGFFDKKEKVWKPHTPDPNAYRNEMEPHKRGSILVAAIFEAFLNIYKRRIADLLRIASNGTGILPQGELHPDLVNRLSVEAATAAQHVLSICIRALDYCPPVDINFGDYLRAIITADIDLVPDDNRGYRIAFIDAFRRRGIFPTGIKTLSEESLQYKYEHLLQPDTLDMLANITSLLSDFRTEVLFTKDRESIFRITQEFIGGSEKERGLHRRITKKFEHSAELEKLTGLLFSDGWERLGIRTSTSNKIPGPSFSLQNLRLINRMSPEGNTVSQIVFSLIQRCGVVVKNGVLQNIGIVPQDDVDQPADAFEFRGGCTMIYRSISERTRVR